MAHPPSASDDLSAPATMPRPTGRTLAVCVAVVILGLAAAGLQVVASGEGLRRALLAYLTAFAFVLSLSLGALFFVLIQHLTRAGWSVLIRRPAELLAANIGVVAVLFIPIAVSVILGHGEIYPWARPIAAKVSHDLSVVPLVPEAGVEAEVIPGGHAAQLPPGYEHQQLDAFTLKKRAYLNTPFFLIRWVVLFAVWGGLGWFFWRTSRRQDVTGDPRLTLRMEQVAGPGCLLFGLTLTFGAFDLLMSLNPHWYSTIFGVYYFSGAVVGAMSMLILGVVGLRHVGALRGITEDHLLDLGRLLFAFVFFWGYIAFCQYMLLWYANMPESTSWLHIRGATTVAGNINAWSWVAIVLLFGHFLIPFVGLMTRHTKRHAGILAGWAVWLLIMHYLDLAWLVMPELGPQLSLGFIELGILVAVCGVYFLGVIQLAIGTSGTPVHDPRLPESLQREALY